LPGSQSSRSVERAWALPIQRPIDVPTRETVAFLAAHLPARARVLEVGCGAGDVAAALNRLEYSVVAIDADAEAVDRARFRGVDARLAAWPAFACDPVHAVAFTRSLHHLGALAPALAEARSRIAPGGVLLVEDFAFADVDPIVLGRFVEWVRARASGLLPKEGELVTDLLVASDPMDVWRARHDRFDLHEARAMAEAIGGAFPRVESRAAPYLYRYLVRVLGESPSDSEVVAAALRWESDAGEAAWIGRRWVASITMGDDSLR